jgi:hypothetical protein
MPMEDIIIHLFCIVDDELKDVKRHDQALLHPSETVTIGVIYALKGGAYRAFYRRLMWNWRHFFPNLPELSRLLRVLGHYRSLTDRFLRKLSFFTVMDSFGIETIHPIREGRSCDQVGKKGKSNHRWIVGVKWCPLINNNGEIVDWDWAPANEHDQVFRPVAEQYDGETITLTDSGFKKADAPPRNIKLCARGTWNERMLIETVNSIITTLFHSKKISQRADIYIEARLSYLTALINIFLMVTDGVLSFTDFTL